MKIAYKLICAGGALLVPIAGLSYVAYDFGQAEQDTLGKQTLQTATASLDGVDRILAERYGDAQAFAGANVLRDKDAWYKVDSPIVKRMNNYVDLYGVYLVTVLIDLEGKPIAVNTRDKDGRPIDTKALWQRSFAAEPWFRDALSESFSIAGARPAPGNERSSGTVVLDAHESDLTLQAYGEKKMVLGFAAPVKGPDGKPVGVWLNVMDLVAVQSILEAKYHAAEAGGLPSAHFTLLDNNGQPVIDLDPSGRGTAAGTATSLAAAAELEAKAGVGAAVASGKGDWRIDEYGGAETVTAFAPSVGAAGFSGLGWSLVVRVDKDEVLAPVATGYKKTVGAVLFALAALAGIIWYALRTISRPLVDMTSSARRLVSSNHKQAVIEKLDLVRKRSVLMYYRDFLWCEGVVVRSFVLA